MAASLSICTIQGKWAKSVRRRVMVDAFNFKTLEAVRAKSEFRKFLSDVQLAENPDGACTEWCAGFRVREKLTLSIPEPRSGTIQRVLDPHSFQVKFDSEEEHKVGIEKAHLESEFEAVILNDGLECHI